MPLTYSTPPKSTWPAFIKLVESMAKCIGISKACIACGIDRGHFQRLKDGQADLTTNAAKSILSAYKKFKAGEAV